MTEEELSQATDGLIQWFDSQSISPHSAGEILTKLVAKRIVMSHDTLEDINLAMTLHHNQLVMEIAKAMGVGGA